MAFGSATIDPNALQVNLQLSKKQMELLKSKKELNIVSAGRGSGKTAITSILAILHLLKGKNVLVIAPSYAQLKDQNFKEILKHLTLMGLATVINYRDLRVKHNGKEIIFVSGGEPERLRGYSEIGTIIFDEAATLCHDSYKLAIATMRALHGQEPKVYIVGTPPAEEDHWVAQLAQREDANVIFASGRDNPFIEHDYLDKLEHEYKYLPEDFRRRELYGELVFTGASNISLFNDFAIAEGCFDYPGEPIVAGLDIAGRGSDSTALCIRKGKQVLGMQMAKTPNDEKLKEFVYQMHEAWNFDVLRYDATGFGHLLTFDKLPEHVLVQGIDFGAGAGERFVNLRTLMYAVLAKQSCIFMKDNDYKLHRDSLMQELRETKYNLETRTRRLCLIDKKQIKERLNGRSPDRADALALAFSYAPQPKPKAVLAPTVFDKYARGIRK